MIEVFDNCDEGCCNFIIDTNIEQPFGWDSQCARPMFEHINDLECIEDDEYCWSGGYLFQATDLDVPGVSTRL